MRKIHSIAGDNLRWSPKICLEVSLAFSS